MSTATAPKRIAEPVLYSTKTVMAVAGVSERQLQWWDEKKVVMPRIEGHKRLYTEEEALLVTGLAQCRRYGLSLQKLRAVRWKMLRLIVHGPEDVLLLQTPRKKSIQVAPYPTIAAAVSASLTPDGEIVAGQVIDLVAHRKRLEEVDRKGAPVPAHWRRK